ncbi:hypothetical protein LPN04_17355 [Rugamonas sp. A1-17]|nr:hypothetical protein [Rugamonas sp. A1-17]
MKEIKRDPDRDQILLGDLNNLTKFKDSINPTQDEVRLHASTVRRLLLDGLLPSAAGSRRIPLFFNVPDVQPIVRAARNGYIACFNLGGIEVFGVGVTGSMISRNERPGDIEFDTSKFISLKLDSFLRQPVAFINEIFVTRLEVINYVANKAGGVHYDPKPSSALPQEKIMAIGQLRHSLRLGLKNGIPVFGFRLDGLIDESTNFRYEPEFLDIIFLEFLATIHFIIESEEVKKLQIQIIYELNNRFQK